MFWCFHCYALNDRAKGPCVVCHQAVEPPDDLSRTEGLVWALRHPDGDRAVTAAKTLGRLHAKEAVPALRNAVETGPDIYVRAESLRSLLMIEGVPPLRPWLESLMAEAPFNVKDIARSALEGRPS